MAEKKVIGFDIGEGSVFEVLEAEIAGPVVVGSHFAVCLAHSGTDGDAVARSRVRGEVTAAVVNSSKI